MKNSFFIKKICFFAYSIFFFSGCAYFNTYFNAKEYFKQAEKIRIETEGESIPISAIDKYGKSIKKSKKVITDFPESKFRKNAILLMAKSQFYRADYDLAIDNLKIIFSDGTKDQKEEAKYWTSICKWKKGNIQTAINDLKNLIITSEKNKNKSMAYLSLAEIHKELKDINKSIIYLKNAATLTNSRDQKGIIYGRLAEMAFNKEDYDLALNGYENVTSYSLSKQNIEKAHLQILKIYRIQKKYRQASKKIKSMLTDDKFKSISGNLELELVQLYRSQGDQSEIEARLETIVNNYQKTSVSAEAYFQLGQIYSSEKWNLIKAKEYFEQVNKEFSRSLFGPMAKGRIEAIKLYNNTKLDLETTIENLSAKISPTDTTKVKVVGMSSKIISEKKTIPELYYQLADLEAFKFERYSESVSYLLKIIEDYPDSQFKPKALFALDFIYKITNERENAKKIRVRLLKEHPESEYTSYLSDSENLFVNEESKLFKNAEKLISKDYIEALKIFKKILNETENSDFKLSTAFSIAYLHDQNTEIDSAFKYYDYIKTNFPATDHSIEASKRMFTLSGIISSLKLDSVKVEME